MSSYSSSTLSTRSVRRSPMTCPLCNHEAKNTEDLTAHVYICLSKTEKSNLTIKVQLCGVMCPCPHTYLSPIGSSNLLTPPIISLDVCPSRLSFSFLDLVN